MGAAEGASGRSGRTGPDAEGIDTGGAVALDAIRVGADGGDAAG